MTDHCTTDFCIWRTICLVPVRCISSICHMYMTDFAYDGPIFLVPLSPSYPSSPVIIIIMSIIMKYWLSLILIFYKKVANILTWVAWSIPCCRRPRTWGTRPAACPAVRSRRGPSLHSSPSPHRSAPASSGSCDLQGVPQCGNSPDFLRWKARPQFGR